MERRQGRNAYIHDFVADWGRHRHQWANKFLKSVISPLAREYCLDVIFQAFSL